MQELHKEFSLAAQSELLAKFPPDWTMQQIRQESMDAAEALAIARKTEIVPMKDFNPRILKQGCYLGTNDLITSLQDYQTDTSVVDARLFGGKRLVKMSRWAWIKVRPEHRPTILDHIANFFTVHGDAKFRTKWGLDVTPSEYIPTKRIIAVRTYSDTEAAMQTLVYYKRWGLHRCNVVADNTLGPGIYAYPDIQSILDKFDNRKKDDRKVVIGLLSGYLLKVDKVRGRISLDPRSCRLFGFFAPIEEPLELPFRMGEEDKYALRLSPET